MMIEIDLRWVCKFNILINCPALTLDIYTFLISLLLLKISAKLLGIKQIWKLRIEITY